MLQSLFPPIPDATAGIVTNCIENCASEGTNVSIKLNLKYFSDMICNPRPILFFLSNACRAYGGEERRIKVLVEKPEGKRQLGRHRLKWEDNINLLAPELFFF